MRKLLEEIMQVDQEVAAQPPVENAIPEITPELIASLVEQMPELAEIDQEELEKGMAVEVEHYESLGQDMLAVAKVAVDHIKETPEGKSYYDALAQMENELQEAPEEEEAEHTDDMDVDVSSEDLPVENVEEDVTEAKEEPKE